MTSFRDSEKEVGDRRARRRGQQCLTCSDGSQIDGSCHERGEEGGAGRKEEKGVRDILSVIINFALSQMGSCVVESMHRAIHQLAGTGGGQE